MEEMRMEHAREVQSLQQTIKDLEEQAEETRHSSSNNKKRRVSNTKDSVIYIDVEEKENERSLFKPPKSPRGRAPLSPKTNHSPHLHSSSKPLTREQIQFSLSKGSVASMVGKENLGGKGRLNHSPPPISGTRLKSVFFYQFSTLILL